MAVLDAVPNAVLVVGADDRIRVANAAATDLLGRPAGSLVGSTLAEAVLTAGDRDGYRTRLQRVADGHGTATPAHVVVTHADGTGVPVEVTVRPVPGAEPPLFGVSLRDVGASQAAEGRRRTLRTIVDTLPDPIVAVDRAGRVVLQNEAVARRFAGGPGQRVALPAEWQRRADEAMQSGTPAVHEETDPAGGVWLTSRVPVTDAAGAVVGLVAISRDVTAQRAAEAQLVADKQAAEAAARANREFLATTSHEVRTLMSGVTGMTTLLLHTDLDGEQREFVDTIRTSGGALLGVINDVLDFSKIEAGMLSLEAHPFDVREAVAEAVRMVAQQGEAKGIELSWDVRPDVPETVSGDAGRVRQVLLNLLSNAIKFTAEGSVRVRVALAGPGALAVAVEDTGVGIAPDRLDAIFEQFEQADASTARTHGGTGLGLSIARRLVQMMGGDLSAESTLGEGSVFRFTVADAGAAGRGGSDAEPEGPTLDAEPTGRTWADGPSAGDGAVGRPAPTAPPAPEAPDAGASPGVVMSMDAIVPAARVLLAEDNPVNQRVAVLTLRRLGYRPEVVPDGAKAVFAVRNRPYDVVLMDVMMPVMDGLEATRQIRADPGPHPPPAIVALTANVLDGDRQRCLDAGCDDYLAKPVAPEVLAATIERAVRRAPADA